MKLWTVLASLVLLGCTQPADAPAAGEEAVRHTAPAGDYTLDKSHGSLIVRLSHLSYSKFVARFENWDAALRLDPAAPENASIQVRIDPLSIASDNPPAGFIDIMRGPEFLDAGRFSEIRYISRAIERTGPNTARVAGDLSLHGVTGPVSLDVRFNGGYEGMHLDPHARIGFSARGLFMRSDFGMRYGVPAPGSDMGVGDAVEVLVEAEFNGPEWTQTAAGAR